MPTRLSGWGEVISVFHSPTDTFTRLRQRESPFMPPYIVSILLGAIGTALSLPVTLRLMERELQASGLATATAFSALRTWTLIGGVVGAFIGPVVVGLFIAMLILGISWFKGESASFRALFAAIGYARLPLSVGTLITSLLVSNAASVAELRRVSLSPAILLPEGSPAILVGLLSALGPFSLWYILLVAHAVAALTGTPLKKAWWPSALLLGVSVLFALLGSGTTAFSLQ